MATPIKVLDRVRCVGNGWSAIQEHKTSRGEIYLEGNVTTQHGYVHVYAEPHHNCTNLDFIYRGNHYERSIGRFYSARHIVTLAKQFAEEYATG